MEKLAPICLFVYNRLEETKKTIRALLDNPLSQNSNLFIFSDGPKSREMTESVLEVRTFLKTVKGFRSVSVNESKENRGLAQSIVSGVSQILNENDSVIVLEDDLITSPNFLSFMNESLSFYKTEPLIGSITGFSFPIVSSRLLEEDVYFFPRFFSWGWAIWKDRWEKIDWSINSDTVYIKEKPFLKYFKSGGNDQHRMLLNTFRGELNSWAIIASAHQAKNQLLTVVPKLSKIQNIGFESSATHMIGNHDFIYRTNLDSSQKVKFKFSRSFFANKLLGWEVRWRYSNVLRGALKVINMLK